MSIDRDRLAELAGRPHRQGPRYRNLKSLPAHGLVDFLRWQWDTGARFPALQRFPLRHPDPDRIAHPGKAPQLTWLGHASFLFQFAGLNLLTDPVFSERCSPIGFVGPRRGTPPALTVDTLPEIHRVLISHNHYDHLDLDTVRALRRRFGDTLRFYVPAGLAGWFRREGIDNLVELDWYQSEHSDEVESIFVPAQHFSGRGALDRNRSLWGGWRLHFRDFSFYFAGDTGYSETLFAEMREALGPVDLALLPIGAYAPRWFMSPVHVAPEEAVHIHRDLEARRSVAMHWGTFVLTDEPMHEPPERLRAAMQEQGVAPDEFLVLEHGEMFVEQGFAEV
jgi:N-acyl-phosphatidylethanolamine-hydrolysing phospholipase D